MPIPRPLNIVTIIFAIFIAQSAAAVNPIDASVLEVGVKDKYLFTNQSISILTASYEVISLTIEKHEQTPVCRWFFPQPQGQPTTAVAEDRLNFWIDFFLDNKPFTKELWNLEKGEYFGKKIFTDASKKLPLSAGKHTLSCKVTFNYATPGDQPEDPNPQNNLKSARLFAANSAWDALYPEEIPQVSVKAEPSFANLTPDLEIVLTPVEHGIPIRGKYTFEAYAKNTKLKELVQYEITRLVGGQEIAVGKLLLDLDNPYKLDNRVILHSGWFSKHNVGAGDYRVRALFIQATQSGNTVGPITKDAASFTLAKLELIDRPPEDANAGPDGQPTAVGSAALQPEAAMPQPATALTDTVTPATPTETTAAAGSATELTGTETPTNTVAPASPVTTAAVHQPALAQPIGEQPDPTALATTAAPANPRASGLAAAPNPCSMAVTYYVPQPPVIESSFSSVEVSDQVRIRCDFKAVTETIEWSVCDDQARNKMASLALSQTSNRRYSGKITIDGLNMGVTSSPAEGGDYSGERTWSYEDAGSHEVGCEIDNGLHYVVENTETWLRQVVSHKIGALTELERLRSFDPASVIQLATELLQAQIEPIPAGSLARLKPGSFATSTTSDSQSPGFDPRSEYPGVNQEQGAVKQDSDLNTQPDPPPDQPDDPG